MVLFLEAQFVICESATRGSTRPEYSFSVTKCWIIILSLSASYLVPTCLKIIHLTASAAHIAAYLLARVSPDDVFAGDAI